MKKVITVIDPKKKERNLKSSKITREEIKEKYLPLILKHIRPLKFISKRSNSLASLNELTKENKFKKLYSLISNKYFLIQALGNISSNKGSLTPGINAETIDGMSLNRIEILSEKLKTGKFKFQPYRRKFVPKPTKKGEPIKYRPLGIPNFEDRIVQSAIQMILEAIYEPIFENTNLNFGFRPGKSPHNAIQRLKITGTGCDFAIEGDIKGAFDYVDPSTMIKILEKRIDDKKFIDLIKQGFKCGLMDQGIYKDTLLGTPQGGIASPTLFNIYMHEFDLFIKNELNDIIEKKNNFEKRTRIGANNKIYTAISQRIY
jgi:retron-type reverse transcriptase